MIIMTLGLIAFFFINLYSMVIAFVLTVPTIGDAMFTSPSYAVRVAGLIPWLWVATCWYLFITQLQSLGVTL
jgi:hypothetical protein